MSCSALGDIGLPKRNGIEVAERVSKVAAPGARLLIVSSESSVDVVREALRAGHWATSTSQVLELSYCRLLRRFLKAGILSVVKRRTALTMERTIRPLAVMKSSSILMIGSLSGLFCKTIGLSATV